MKKWANEMNKAFSKEEVQIGQKTHEEKYSTSLAIKEMQIKTRLRLHLTHRSEATIKNINNNKCW
jgi:hypothetical protein